MNETRRVCFEPVARLRKAGFRVAHENPARGSRRFVVYLATKPG